ncbi:MAG: acetylxylan esterase [Cellulomonas sp.]
MAFFDLPIPELETYLPEREKLAGFDDFWSSTIAEARAKARTTRRPPVDSGCTELITEDIEFDVLDAQRIRGWFVAPRHRGRAGPLWGVP